MSPFTHPQNVVRLSCCGQGQQQVQLAGAVLDQNPSALTQTLLDRPEGFLPLHQAQLLDSLFLLTAEIPPARAWQTDCNLLENLVVLKQIAASRN